MLWGISGIIAWVVCGILAYGLDFAHFQRFYPELADDDYEKDRISSMKFALAGPIALAVTLSCEHHKHGFKWK